MINWVNFLNFLKEKSQRSIDKLYNGPNSQISNFQLNNQLNLINPFLNVACDTKNEDKNTYIDNDKSQNNDNLTSNNEKNQFDLKQILVSKIGLTNLGLTCYMNSALQILLHTDNLIEKLLDFYNPFFDNITKTFVDLIKDLIFNDYKKECDYIIKSFSPIKFKNKFISLHSNFSSGQHDSIEFIRIFLDDISRDTNKSSSDYKELILLGESKYELSNKYHNYYISRENSIIMDIYYTQMINIFTCKCGKETYSFEKLLDIPLLIIENLKEIQLEELIHDYLKEISVNIDELCSNCKEKKRK